MESFGQSELGGFMALGFPELEPDDAKLSRVGPPLPDKEVGIVDDEDRSVPAGSIGRIVPLGGFMAGYWNDPDRTATATRDGWLRTGDLGLIDADGSVTMRGRASELIVVAGRARYPGDVEEALCRVPGVRQAALIGLPDPDLGQSPRAFVTLDRSAAVDGPSLKAAILSQSPATRRR